MDSVRESIEKFSYCATSELKQIGVIAENIISTVIANPTVLYNVSCVREKNESTYSHLINVATISVILGIKMNLNLI